MEFCKLILTFESVDKFLLCDHSNEIFSTVLSRSAVCFCAFSKRIFDLGHSGSERVKSFSPLFFFFVFSRVLFLSWTALASHAQTFFWFVTQSSTGTRLQEKTFNVPFVV